MSITTKQAVDKLCKELKEDEGFWFSWKANIAMSFYDAYERVYGSQEKGETLHEISNDAAENFLKQLTYDR